MKVILMIIGLLTGLATFGQSLERQVIASAGLEVSNSVGGLSMTVGELVINSSILSTVHFTQGFQQVESVDLSSIQAQRLVYGALKAFPNPTTGELHVQSNLISSGIITLQYQLTDLHGRTVMSGTIPSDEAVLDLSALAASTYTLNLRSSGSQFAEHISIVKISN